jgi:hypothetical protein
MLDVEITGVVGYDLKGKAIGAVDDPADDMLLPMMPVMRHQ